MLRPEAERHGVHTEPRSQRDKLHRTEAAVYDAPRLLDFYGAFHARQIARPGWGEITDGCRWIKLVKLGGEWELTWLVGWVSSVMTVSRWPYRFSVLGDTGHASPGMNNSFASIVSFCIHARLALYEEHPSVVLEFVKWGKCVSLSHHVGLVSLTWLVK